MGWRTLARWELGFLALNIGPHQIPNNRTRRAANRHMTTCPKRRRSQTLTPGVADWVKIGHRRTEVQPITGDSFTQFPPCTWGVVSHHGLGYHTFGYIWATVDDFDRRALQFCLRHGNVTWYHQRQHSEAMQFLRRASDQDLKVINQPWKHPKLHSHTEIHRVLFFLGHTKWAP